MVFSVAEIWRFFLWGHICSHICFTQELLGNMPHMVFVILAASFLSIWGAKNFKSLLQDFGFCTEIRVLWNYMSVCMFRVFHFLFVGNVYKFQTGSRFHAILWHKHLDDACKSNKPQVRLWKLFLPTFSYFPENPYKKRYLFQSVCTGIPVGTDIIHYSVHWSISSIGQRKII